LNNTIHLYEYNIFPPSVQISVEHDEHKANKKSNKEVKFDPNTNAMQESNGNVRDSVNLCKAISQDSIIVKQSKASLTKTTSGLISSSIDNLELNYRKNPP